MSVGVAILHDDVRVLDEVAHLVDRTGGLHVAGLGETADADVVLIGGTALASFTRNGSGVVVLSTGEPLADARAGFALGAVGLLRWPDDAEALGRLVAGAAAASTEGSDADRAPCIGVIGARGGAGVSVVAALLARAIAGSILCDFDFAGAGQLAFAAEDAGASFARVAAVPTPDVVAEACEPHAAGRALLVRAGTPAAPDAVLEAVVDAARRSAAAVVVDAGSRQMPFSPAVLVCADDLASLRAAKRLTESAPDLLIVLNRLRRRGLRTSHFAKALGREPVAVLPPDRRLARAADLGVLPRRLPRPIHALAKLVMS
ncbi:MAG: hypothetical protein ABR548_14545 [Actinomycetota bacterium]|nr:hypothetical protein [Actinomycetota bacterium]